VLNLSSKKKVEAHHVFLDILAAYSSAESVSIKYDVLCKSKDENILHHKHQQVTN